MLGNTEEAYVVFLRPISKLSRKDIEELSPAPTLFAVGVVGEVVRAYFAQPILEIVRPRPWIGGGGNDCWWRFKAFGFLLRWLAWLNNSESGHVRLLAAGLPRKVCEYPGGGSQ